MVEKCESIVVCSAPPLYSLSKETFFTTTVPGSLSFPQTNLIFSSSTVDTITTTKSLSIAVFSAVSNLPVDPQITLVSQKSLPRLLVDEVVVEGMETGIDQGQQDSTSKSQSQGLLMVTEENFVPNRDDVDEATTTSMPSLCLRATEGMLL